MSRIKDVLPLPSNLTRNGHLTFSMQLANYENRSVVFGGLDGLITILAIISGAAGTLFYKILARNFSHYQYCRLFYV